MTFCITIDREEISPTRQEALLTRKGAGSSLNPSRAARGLIKVSDE